jgi:hypothetical protein
MQGSECEIISPVELNTFGYISKCNTSENIAGHYIFNELLSLI